MSSFFEQEFDYAPEVAAEAPGRVEFIGNHTDYNGGMVMGVAVDRRIRVEAALRNDMTLRMASAQADCTVELQLSGIVPQQGPASWANYVLGVVKVLRDDGMKVNRGLDVFVNSDLPTGAGLSSSAALELSTAFAVTQLFGYTQDRATLARLGRKAENTFVGVPCGILDQGVSAFGKEGHLVQIDCATEQFSTVPMPSNLRFWIFNTLEKHSLVESLYATRNKECREALQLLKEQGVKAPNLASADPDAVRSASLPENLRKRALHVTQEHRRVQSMAKALVAGDERQIGELLFASHASSRDLFENSTPQLDALVEILHQTPHIVGARLTGGGFGGAVMALTTDAFGESQADAVINAFAKRHPKHAPTVFSARAGNGARVVC